MIKGSNWLSNTLQQWYLKICWYELILNSLWPSVWCLRACSTLAQVMAYCLTTPRHYLNQCWLAIGVSEILWYSSQCKWHGLSWSESGVHSLQWRHNGRDSFSNHQPRNCLLNRLIRCRSKKTSKLHVTGLCAGNSPETGEFPAQRASNTENVPIWWRHHVRRLFDLVRAYFTHSLWAHNWNFVEILFDMILILNSLRPRDAYMRQ